MAIPVFEQGAAARSSMEKRKQISLLPANYRNSSVHQHHIEVLFEGGQGFAPVRHYRDVVSLFLHLLVDRIVFRQ